MKNLHAPTLLLLVLALVTVALPGAAAAAIPDEIHLTQRTVDASGQNISGTFQFQFKIGPNQDCSSPLYINSVTLTTDASGYVDHYLPDVDLPFDQQYVICIYRDTQLVSRRNISRVPYAFNARNVSWVGVSGRPTKLSDFSDDIGATSTFNSTYEAKRTDNESWNQSLADSRYAVAGTLGDNSSWNQTLAGTLYAPISTQADNSSWNESRANSLYSPVRWGYNMTEPAQAYCNATFVNKSGDTVLGSLNFTQGLRIPGQQAIVFEKDGSIFANNGNNYIFPDEQPDHRMEFWSEGNMLFQTSFSGSIRMFANGVYLDGYPPYGGVVIGGNGDTFTGINNTFPQKTLDVGGDIQASESVIARAFCNSTGSCVSNWEFGSTSSGGNESFNQTLTDSLYGSLASSNSWSGDNTFNGGTSVEGTLYIDNDRNISVYREPSSTAIVDNLVVRTNKGALGTFFMSNKTKFRIVADSAAVNGYFQVGASDETNQNGNLYFSGMNGNYSELVQFTTDDVIISNPKTSSATFVVDSTSATGSGSAILDLRSKVGNSRTRWFSYYGGGNYFQAGNYAFNGNQPLYFTGYNGNQGSLVRFHFANINMTGNTTIDEKLIVKSATSYQNFAVCYLAGGQLGHCTDAVNTTGGCTCAIN